MQKFDWIGWLVAFMIGFVLASSFSISIHVDAVPSKAWHSGE